MSSMIRFGAVATFLLAVATLSPVRADEAQPSDEGKGAAFKGKKIEMKDKAEVAMLLSFEAGEEFEATTKGERQTDVHLFVYDEAGKAVGKDDTTGPICSVKATAAKAGKYKFVVKHFKGENTVTFDVKVAK